MGWKTYLAAAVTILYGVGFEGIFNGNWAAAVNYVLAGLSLIGIRSALTKVINKI